MGSIMAEVVGTGNNRVDDCHEIPHDSPEIRSELSICTWRDSGIWTFLDFAKRRD